MTRVDPDIDEQTEHSVVDPIEMSTDPANNFGNFQLLQSIWCQLCLPKIPNTFLLLDCRTNDIIIKHSSPSI